jgi:hypothetical protein
MSDATHRHEHVHGPGCGHVAVVHEGHIDFLHDGHLHHPHGDHLHDHVLPVDEEHPDGCGSGHPCTGHAPDHVHGPGCGHEAVPHGDHVDYLVNGHLHHQHDGHCDDHGTVVLADD